MSASGNMDFFETSDFLSDWLVDLSGDFKRGQVCARVDLESRWESTDKERLVVRGTLCLCVASTFDICQLFDDPVPVVHPNPTQHISVFVPVQCPRMRCPWCAWCAMHSITISCFPVAGSGNTTRSLLQISWTLGPRTHLWDGLCQTIQSSLWWQRGPTSALWWWKFKQAISCWGLTLTMRKTTSVSMSILKIDNSPCWGSRYITLFYYLWYKSCTQPKFFKLNWGSE